MLEDINKCEDKFISLFSKKFKFSNNLIKYEDEIVNDMYDHNYFKHNKNTSIKEVIDAYHYQIEKGDEFLKLISQVKLNSKIVKTLGLEETIILTMLHNKKTINFKINEFVKIKDVTINDLNKIELKHYGKLYGETFILRRNKEFIKTSRKHSNFRYIGAYINDKIVGACHFYTYKNYTCLDSLIVDNRYRHKYIASALIKYVLDNSENLYLHADNREEVKNMYKKLGFKKVAETYEYLKTI